MWNQDNFDPAGYENDPFERFASPAASPRPGAPTGPGSSMCLPRLRARPCGGRARYRRREPRQRQPGREQGEDIRRWFVEQDVVEGVILLPDNLFYNTTAAGILVCLRRDKPAERRGRVVLVNASGEFQKGRPKNFIPDAAIQKIADAFHAGEDVPRFVPSRDARRSPKHDCNLSPSRYVETAAPAEHRDIQTILDDLAGLMPTRAASTASSRRSSPASGTGGEGRHDARGGHHRL